MNDKKKNYLQANTLIIIKSNQNLCTELSLFLVIITLQIKNCRKFKKCWKNS